MRALLAHPDRDLDLAPSGSCDAEALTRDLGLDLLVEAMAGGDAFIADVARRAIFASPGVDAASVGHRQAVLRDCLAAPDQVRGLYALVEGTLNRRRKEYWDSDLLRRHPSSILYGSLGVLKLFLDALAGLRLRGEAEAQSLASPGFRRLFAELEREADGAWIARAWRALDALEFKDGLWLRAGLDAGARGTGYEALPEPGQGPWWARLLRRIPEERSFRVDERDLQGSQYLAHIQDQGVNRLANVLAQSSDHVGAYLESLRLELGFYLACLNLKERLAALGAPVSFPVVSPHSRSPWRAEGLYDPSLALALGRAPVASDCDFAGRSLALITGANRGGKSSFLRSVGTAQLLAQMGCFVPARTLDCGLGAAVFTHFKREEGELERHGRLDEELERFSRLAERLRPGALVLFNESFSSTNEREGSELAAQIVRALTERGMRVLFVTHFYDFASRFGPAEALFLRAERLADGTRTFRLDPGLPERTSFAADVYAEVFGEALSASRGPSPSAPESSAATRT